MKFIIHRILPLENELAKIIRYRHITFEIKAAEEAYNSYFTKLYSVEGYEPTIGELEQLGELQQSLHSTIDKKCSFEVNKILDYQLQLAGLEPEKLQSLCNKIYQKCSKLSDFFQRKTINFKWKSQILFWKIVKFIV